MEPFDPWPCAEAASRIHLVLHSVEVEAFSILPVLTPQVGASREEVERADAVSQDIILVVERKVGLVVREVVDRVERVRHQQVVPLSRFVLEESLIVKLRPFATPLRQKVSREL